MPLQSVIAGQRFSAWTTLREVRIRKQRAWVCRCDCGAELTVQQRYLLVGRSKSCQKCSVKRRVCRTVKIGARFGLLQIVSDLGCREGVRYVGAICDCGASHEVRWTNIYSGAAKSCGCLCHGDNVGFQPTHGMSRTPIYHIWSGMLDRCTNPDNEAWRHYGGRGITVCERWMQFESFFADMGDRPSSKHSIDRIDVNGNYEPSNCRWATPREQATNKRNNVWIAHQGRRMLSADWATELGISRQAIEQRIKSGWPIDRVLTIGATTGTGLRSQYRCQRCGATGHNRATCERSASAQAAE